MPEVIDMPESNVFSAYGSLLYKGNHRLIKRLKKDAVPSVHGHKRWFSSYLLMDYFRENPPAKKMRVLDVGCGWGPTSVYMARVGCKVTGLDVDEMVFPYLDAHAELNDVKIATRKGSMDAMKKKDLQKFDLIVGGDICFWDALKKSWFNLMKRAEQAGVKKVVLADPGREPFLELYDKAAEKWDTDFLHWYSLEPRRHEGYLLEVNFK